MRSVHFRLSDSMYARVQEEAEHEGVSIAHFAREAAIARAAIYAARRGMRWGDPEGWDQLLKIIEQSDRKDAKLRAAAARRKRTARHTANSVIALLAQHLPL